MNSGTEPLGESSDLIVRVLPGRRRFHVEDCRLLAGHAPEEISLGEARDEGFTACTACIPRRESLASVMQQVERTERVLKSLWRERHEPKADWAGQYRLLETQSEQVRRTALIILQNLLG